MIMTSSLACAGLRRSYCRPPKCLPWPTSLSTAPQNPLIGGQIPADLGSIGIDMSCSNLQSLNLSCLCCHLQQAHWPRADHHHTSQTTTCRATCGPCPFAHLPRGSQAAISASLVKKSIVHIHLIHV